MHRLFVYLALTAAGFGLYLLFTGPETHVASAGVHGLTAAPISISYNGWAMGLLMGLVAAWLARVDWSDLPARLGDWLRLQRRRLWLAMWGGLFAGILLLF